MRDSNAKISSCKTNINKLRGRWSDDSGKKRSKALLWRTNLRIYGLRPSICGVR